MGASTYDFAKFSHISSLRLVYLVDAIPTEMCKRKIFQNLCNQKKIADVWSYLIQRRTEIELIVSTEIFKGKLKSFRNWKINSRKLNNNSGLLKQFCVWRSRGVKLVI